MASTGSSHHLGHTSSFQAVPHSFRHWFPLLPSPVFGVSDPIYGLDVAGDGGHSVVLHSRKELGQKEAYRRLSVALALLSVYFGAGLKERAPGAIGGYFAAPSHEESGEHIYREDVMATIGQLERANDPYQIQARFTLSRGLALISDPESAIIEFFKLTELYIKQLAYAGALDPAARKNVLEDKIIFARRVKEDLVARGILTEELVDLIFTMKEVRNKFVGHGGMRPALGELFGDPENYEQLLEQSPFRYDPYLRYGPDFFERVLNDITLVGGFLFAKMQGIEPLVFVRPGCWYQASSHVQSVLAAEGAQWISHDESRFLPR